MPHSSNKLHLLKHLSRLWNIFSRKRKHQLILVLVVTSFTALLDLISIAAIMPLISVLINPEVAFNNVFLKPIFNFFAYSSAEEIILPITISFIIINVLSTIVKVVIFRIQTKITVLCGLELSKSVYSRSIYQPFSVHIARNSSDVISSIVNNVNITVFHVLYPSVLFISSLLFAVTIFIGLMFIDYTIGIISILSLLIFYLPISFFLKKTLINNSEVIDFSQKKLVRLVQESLGGIRNLILNKTHHYFIQKYHNVDSDLRFAIGSNKFLSGVPRYVVESIIITLLALLGLYIYYYLPGGINAGLPVVGAMALGAQKLLPNVQQIYRSYATISGSRENLIDTLLLAEQEYDSELESKINDKSILDFKKLSLKNVSFSYQNSEELTFNEINLEINKGDKIGIVGPTGCGKTTLLDILLGFLDPTSGEFLIDGKNISDVKQDWQKSISLVPQDIFLSDNSYLENIAFGCNLRDIDFDKVQQSSKNADIYDHIIKQKEGFDTHIGESGSQLSGGQRQRIAIARSFYRDSKVIVLDEATSALDTKTENTIVEAIKNLDQEHTVLTIAHRTSTIEHCDKIILVGNSNIEVFDSFEEYSQNTI